MKHYNPETQKVGTCSAKSKESCTFFIQYGEAAQHFENEEDMYLFVEEEMSKRFAQTAAIKKNPELTDAEVQQRREDFFNDPDGYVLVDRDSGVFIQTHEAYLIDSPVPSVDGNYDHDGMLDAHMNAERDGDLVQEVRSLADEGYLIVSSYDGSYIPAEYAVPVKIRGNSKLSDIIEDESKAMEYAKEEGFYLYDKPNVAGPGRTFRTRWGGILDSDSRARRLCC